mgnify:FL=1
MLQTVISLKRSDTTGTYLLLMMVFAPAIVTSAYLKNKIKCQKNWSEIVTASDEAFILLALLSSWNTFVSENLKITSDEWPKKEARWSTAGRGKNWSKFVGWKPESIVLNMSLFDEVTKDRADLERNKTFDQKIKTLVIDTMSQRDQNNINKVTNDRTVTASYAPMEDALDRMFENVE